MRRGSKSNNIGKFDDAIKVMQDGGIVIFPTDTAYGIGCRIDNEDSVTRLFKLRKRSNDKATPVLVSSLEMAKNYWRVIPDDVVEKLINPYWPGALTIVSYSKQNLVPALVMGGGNTIGLRMPDSEKLVRMIQGIGVPIIGTSANFAGEQTPYNFEDLDSELMKLVDLVICETDNNSKLQKNHDRINLSSTVIDCTDKEWKILRQGAVRIAELK